MVTVSRDPDSIQYRSKWLLKMQNINVQDKEKDGYSDTAEEMKETAGCSSTVLIDAGGAGWSRLKKERKKCLNSRKHPECYRRELQGWWSLNVTQLKEVLKFGARGSLSPSSKWRIEIWSSIYSQKRCGPWNHLLSLWVIYFDQDESYPIDG